MDIFSCLTIPLLAPSPYPISLANGCGNLAPEGGTSAGESSDTALPAAFPACVRIAPDHSAAQHLARQRDQPAPQLIPVAETICALPSGRRLTPGYSADSPGSPG